MRALEEGEPRVWRIPDTAIEIAEQKEQRDPVLSARKQAADAGVKDVGHGQLLDEKTLKRMAKEGVFLSTQPFTECSEPQLSDFSNSKLAIVCKGTAFVYETAKKIDGLKITYGTDLFFVPPEVFAKQTKMMERLLKWYEPVEILRTIHSFDPCIACAVHVTDPDGEELMQVKVT